MKQVLNGVTERFKGDGRKLGYPTANLDIETDLKDGVYFGYAELVKWRKHPSIIFIGAPITMGDKRRRVEAHLFDIPDNDYYGEKLELSVEHFYRGNQAFEGAEQLKWVMARDEAAARQWFSSGSDRP